MDRRNFLRTGGMAVLGSLAMPSLAMPESVRGALGGTDHKSAVAAAIKKAGYNAYIAESEEHLEEGIRKGNITEADADAIRELKKTTAEQKLANLPEQMIQNIAKGRLAKFFKENCLVDQEFQFGDGDKQTVGEYLKKVNADLKIVAYKRFTLAAE